MTKYDIEDLRKVYRRAFGCSVICSKCCVAIDAWSKRPEVDITYRSQLIHIILRDNDIRIVDYGVDSKNLRGLKNGIRSHQKCMAMAYRFIEEWEKFKREKKR